MPSSHRILLVAALLSSFAGADEYAGKYAGTPILAELERKLPGAVEDARRNALEKLRLAPTDASRIVVEFADAGTSPFHAVTRTVKRNGATVERIVLHLEYLVSGQSHLDGEVRHEYVHAVLRQAMGERYDRGPDWMREGLAVWAAGQLPSRAQEIAAAALLGKLDPAASLDGLADADHGMDDYAEDALAFELVALRKGPEGVPRVVAAVVGGGDPERSIAEEVVMTWPAFLEEHARFAREELGRIGSSAREFQRAQADPAALRKWTDCDAEPCYQVSATYALAKQDYKAGDYQSAAGGFRAVLTRFVEFGAYQDDARYRLAKCWQQLGRHDEALAEFEILFRDYSYAPPQLLADARVFRAKVRLARREFAEALSDAAAAHQTGTTYGADALYEQGQALEGLGRGEEAIAAYRKLLAEHPRLGIRPEIEARIAALSRR